jgi:hypothetical protein
MEVNVEILGGDGMVAHEFAAGILERAVCLRAALEILLW